MSANPESLERDLIYALRVSSVLPTLKSMKTLESRWQTSNVGAGGAGLKMGRKARNFSRVQKFLEAEYLDHARRILNSEEEAYRDKLLRAKNDTARESARAAWISKLKEYKRLFIHELKGLDETVDEYIRNA